MGPILKIFARVIALGLCGATSVLAGAQVAEQNSTVVDRERRLQSPALVRVGSFIVEPSLGGDLSYNDNIFASSADERDDLLVELRAEGAIRSDFTRHSVQGRLYYSPRWHATYSSQDFAEYGLAAEGRFDIGVDGNIIARVSADRLAEARGSLSSFRLAREPTRFTATVAEATFAKRFSTFGVAVTGRYAHYGYGNATIGTVEVDQSFRDFSLYEASAQGTYGLPEGTRLLVRGNVERRRYRRRPGDPEFDPITQLDRSADGHRIEIGAIRELTSLILATLRFGYLNYDYADDALPDLSGFSYFANVDWNVTTLTNISLSAERRVDETSSPQSAGNLRDELRLSVDHELLRTVILSADVRRAWIDPAAGLRPSRELEFGIGGRYYFARNLRLEAEYRHAQRRSEEAAIAFRSNALLIGVRFSL